MPNCVFSELQSVHFPPPALYHSDPHNPALRQVGTMASQLDSCFHSNPFQSILQTICQTGFLNCKPIHATVCLRLSRGSYCLEHKVQSLIVMLTTLPNLPTPPSPTSTYTTVPPTLSAAAFRTSFFKSQGLSACHVLCLGCSAPQPLPGFFLHVKASLPPQRSHPSPLVTSLCVQHPVLFSFNHSIL